MNAKNFPAIVISQAEEITQLRAMNEHLTLEVERLTLEIQRLTNEPKQPVDISLAPTSA